MSSVYRVTGSIHDQIMTEGAAEVVSEASAEISICLLYTSDAADEL